MPQRFHTWHSLLCWCIYFLSIAIFRVSRKTKLSLFTCVSSSSHLQLQELNLQLRLETAALQIQDIYYLILSSAKKQLSTYPQLDHCILQLRHTWKNVPGFMVKIISKLYNVQSKIQNLAELETSCTNWNRLVMGFTVVSCLFFFKLHLILYPQLSIYWGDEFNLKLNVHCAILNSLRLRICWISALYQSRYTWCHNKVLFVQATKLIKLFVGIQFVQVFEDLSNFHADHYPIPFALLIVSYRPFGHCRYTRLSKIQYFN